MNAFQVPEEVQVCEEINESFFEELGVLRPVEYPNHLWLCPLIFLGAY